MTSRTRFSTALRAATLLAVAGCVTAAPKSSTAPAAPQGQAQKSQIPGGCSTPARERPAEIGCYLTATQAIGVAPSEPLFWHLDAFHTRADAEAARGERGTVVESLGRIWLFTIAEEAWRPPGGIRVGHAGPFAMTAGRSYIARYMEAVLPPGIPSIVHRHTGGEAWYVDAGAQCLETPDSTIVVRAGRTAFVPEGPPMVLLGIGTEVRRTIVAVVHDADQPWMSMASDWAPKGTCPK